MKPIKFKYENLNIASLFLFGMSSVATCALSVVTCVITFCDPWYGG